MQKQFKILTFRELGFNEIFRWNKIWWKKNNHKIGFPLRYYPDKILSPPQTIPFSVIVATEI